MRLESKTTTNLLCFSVMCLVCWLVKSFLEMHPDPRNGVSGECFDALVHERRRMSTLRCGSPKRATTAPRLLLSVGSFAVHPSPASFPFPHVAGKLRGEAKRPSRTPGRGMGAFLPRCETKAVRLHGLSSCEEHIEQSKQVGFKENGTYDTRTQD